MSRARFEKCVRLLTAAQFDAAFKHGRRLSAGPLAAVVAANSHGHPRIGFAVGKKFAKRAVQRNRVKRRLREQFRLAQHGLQAVDVVILLRAPLPHAEAAEVQAAAALWNRIIEKCARPSAAS